MRNHRLACREIQRSPLSFVHDDNQKKDSEIRDEIQFRSLWYIRTLLNKREALRHFGNVNNYYKLETHVL